MKKSQILAIAALAAAATFQTAAKAEDPISPVQGAVCNLYWVDVPDADEAKDFSDFAASLPREPAAATFADMAGDFKDVDKREGVESNAGMWTGWLKQERAGTYTFLCKRNQSYMRYCYSIWVNGKKCVDGEGGQTSFNVDLNAGFNAIQIIIGSYNGNDWPLSISYKKAGSLKEPVSFGPGDMWHDDEE